MNKEKCRILLALTVILCLLGCRENNPLITTDATTTVSTTETSLVQDTSGYGEETYGVEDEDDQETEPTIQDKEEDKTEETTAPTIGSEQEGTTAPTVGSEQEGTTAPTQPEGSASAYKAYMDMSADEQAAFIASFDSIDAFMDWFNKAKAEYDSTEGSIDIGSGSIDLEDILGGK